MLRAGPDHALWAIFDTIVDSYFPFADHLEEVVDRLQNSVVDKPDRQTLEELFDLKRDLIAVRRAVSPVREILNQLTNRELALIDNDEVIYFRDIYDHVIRLTDEIDTDRELVAATVEIYLSTINNNLSTIMKRLTGVTVILAGVGAIAGIVGMSEAGSAFAGAEAGGFWTVTATIVAITVFAV
jgi:magnesium transporter